MSDNTATKVIVIWEQEFVIPANLTPEEEDAEIDRLGRPALETYMRNHVIERDRRSREKRGRKKKTTPEQEKAKASLKNRLQQPVDMIRMPTDVLDSLYDRKK